MPYIWDEQFLFEQGVFLKVGRELHDTEDKFVELLGEAVSWDIFEHDAGEVCEAVDEVGMIVGKVRRLWYGLSAAPLRHIVSVTHSL